MRYTLTALFLIGFGFSIQGQDLIVTTKSDSFNVRITKIDARYIYFSYDNGVNRLKTLMPLENVAKYERGYYGSNEDETTSSYDFNRREYTKFNLEFYFGYSYLLAKIDPDLKSILGEYYRELKSGSHVGFGLDYFPVENYGFGFRFNRFRTQNETTVMLEDDQGNLFPGPLSDDITTTFIGPTFCMRYIDPGNTFHFFFNSSIGYLAYENDAELGFVFNITGNTVGFLFDTGLEFMIGENFSIGGKVGLLAGSLSKVTVRSGGLTQTINLDDDNREGLGRVDVSATIKVHF